MKRRARERLVDRLFPIQWMANQHAKAAMNNRTKRIIGVATSEKKAEKMIEILGA